SDGTVVAWGDNTYGQRNVPIGLTDVKALAQGSGAQHVIVLKQDGTLVGWGRNQYRQRTIPIGLKGVTAVALGYGHTLVATTNALIVPPTIIRGPGSQTTSGGSTLTFSVEALGASSFQWFFNSSPIPSATNASLTLLNVGAVNEGDYFVELSNSAGPSRSS